MATVELDEVELQRLRNQDRTVGVLLSNARIPELEMEAAAKAPVEALEKTVKELQDQIAADKAEREKQLKLDSLNGSMERGFAKLRRDGWLDDGIENVRKLMDEKGILDPEDAAAIYLAKHPPQAPATPSGTGSWNFMEPPADDGDSYTKALMASKSAADNEQLAMTEARKALNEFRGAQRR